MDAARLALWLLAGNAFWLGYALASWRAQRRIERLWAIAEGAVRAMEDRAHQDDLAPTAARGPRRPPPTP